MKSKHAIAILCFVLAGGFYLAAWPSGAFGLAAVGMIFEMAAWVSLLSASRSGAGEKSSGE